MASFDDSARKIFRGTHDYLKLAPSLPQVLIVLYNGGAAAKQQPRLLGTTENSLGIVPLLESKGCTYVVCVFLIPSFLLTFGQPT